MARRRRSTNQTIDLIILMGRLMVYWSVFLLFLETIDWLGVTKSSLRTLDEMAMVATLGLLLVSTWGVRLAIAQIERRRAKHAESND